MNNQITANKNEPTPFILEKPIGEMIKFDTQNGVLANAYFIKAKTPTNKVLFVFHEWWGLNDNIKQEAEKYADKLTDVTVYAIDLYDGEIAYNETTAQQLMTNLKYERGAAIINGLLTKIGSDKIIATIGWCKGGYWSLQSSILLKNQAKACVMYYGMPEKNVELLKNLTCNVLGIFATEDHFINTEMVNEFKKNMEKAGKHLTIHNYAADHAFANPSNPNYNREFTADAQTKALAFIIENLK